MSITWISHSVYPTHKRSQDMDIVTHNEILTKVPCIINNAGQSKDTVNIHHCFHNNLVKVFLLLIYLRQLVQTY